MVDRAEANEGAGRARARLRLDRVTAGYEGGHGERAPRLEDVSLALGGGELVCVLGPNGAGKSTLVKVASGTLKPWAGEVTILDAPAEGLARAAIAKKLAVVEQVQEHAMGFTVREVVAMGRAPHLGVWMQRSAKDEAIVDQAIARCDLGALVDRPAHALSGGEQKRVAVARALAQEPDVLLLDEPGAFMDVRHQLELYELLATEVASRNLACLVVMHDLNIAAQFASHIVLMKGGRVVAQGGVAEVMTWRTLKETFETDLYVGVNELTDARFFLPMRAARGARSKGEEG